MAQQLGEPLDTRIPKSFVGTKPVVGAREGPRIDAAVVHASAHGPLHQPGALQGLDVFRRSREGHVMGRGQLADRVLTLGQALEHGAAGVVAEGAEDEVEALLVFNHMVEYRAAPLIVNYLVEYRYSAAAAA